VITLRILYLLGETSALTQRGIAVELDIDRKIVKKTIDEYIKLLEVPDERALSLKLAQHHKDLKFCLTDIDL
jgi:hypothetical protein